MFDEEKFQPRNIITADIKFCPFRTDKKGHSLNCSSGCALYVGKYPYGQCALFVSAINTMPEESDKEN